LLHYNKDDYTAEYRGYKAQRLITRTRTLAPVPLVDDRCRLT